MTLPEAAVIVGAVASAMMAGLIWFVQIVHYPLLARVSGDAVSSVSQEHRWRTTIVVGPPMALEGITAAILLVERPDGVSVLGPWLAAGALAVALGVTVAVSVPLHMRMSDHGDLVAGRRLVSTNWWRTAAWSARAIITAVMVAQLA